MRVKRGATLVELIVALVLSSLIVTIAAQSVNAHRRNERTISGSSQSASIADETIGVLRSALARVSSADTLLLRGDTAIEMGLMIGGGVPCAAGGDSLVFQDNGVTSGWESPPDSGDRIDALTAGRWWRTEIISARSRTVMSGACAGTQRLLRVRPLPPSGTDIPLLRVTRRVRFMIYRGGDGEWWLGERTCSGAVPHACGAAQPVSGPFAGARALRFAIDTAGSHAVVTMSATAGKTFRTAVVRLYQ